MSQTYLYDTRSGALLSPVGDLPAGYGEALRQRHAWIDRVDLPDNQDIARTRIDVTQSPPAAVLVPLPDPLARRIRKYHRYIDRLAEDIRGGENGTAGPEQAALYRAKAAEARALRASAEPRAENAPILAAEAASLGVPLADLAAEVESAEARWTKRMALIEAVRRRAKRRIGESTDLDMLEQRFGEACTALTKIWQ